MPDAVQPETTPEKLASKPKLRPVFSPRERPGGTGAAPKHVKDHIGVPTVYALPRARRWLDDHGMGHMTLCVTGGLRTPPDIAKALALGADAVALSVHPDPDAARVDSTCQLDFDAFAALLRGLPDTFRELAQELDTPPPTSVTTPPLHAIQAERNAS